LALVFRARANHTWDICPEEVAMCHLIRDAEPERRRAQSTLPPSEPSASARPRLVGALAAVVVAVIAAVALLFPASTPATSAATAEPTAAVEQTSSGMDDGVPSDSHHGACTHEL
jgi:hypothetical protein